MANKNDALHLKKIDSTVQPDNTSYATVRIDELGRIIYNDENGEKVLAYVEDISDATGDLVQKSGDTMTGKLTITPELSSEAIQINASGDASFRLNLPNPGVVEQSWAFQDNDLISSYLNSDGTNVFWGIYDYVLDNDIITYNRSTANPYGSLSFNHPSSFSDSIKIKSDALGELIITDEDEFFLPTKLNHTGLSFRPPPITPTWQKEISVGGNNYITLKRNEDVEDFVVLHTDTAIITLSGNEGQIVTVNKDGKLQVTGNTLDDINNLSHFEPSFIYSEGLEAISAGLGQYFVEIDKEKGNLIAIDADVGTYEEIDIRISSEWTSSEVGTFRLDLDIKSGQTFTFDSSIEGIADIALPATGVASLLFDKPYNSSVWHVRQSV